MTATTPTARAAHTPAAEASTIAAAAAPDRRASGGGEAAAVSPPPAPCQLRRVGRGGQAGDRGEQHRHPYRTLDGGGQGGCRPQDAEGRHGAQRRWDPHVASGGSGADRGWPRAGASTSDAGSTPEVGSGLGRRHRPGPSAGPRSPVAPRHRRQHGHLVTVGDRRPGLGRLTVHPHAAPGHDVGEVRPVTDAASSSTAATVGPAMVSRAVPAASRAAAKRRRVAMVGSVCC